MNGLAIEHLTVRYGGLCALDDVSFSVEPHKIVALIGANGAGKTTVLNCISRYARPTSGTLHFGDVDLLRLWPHQVCGAGIGRTFQNLELCEQLTLRENVTCGFHTRGGSFSLGAMLGLPSSWRAERAVRHQVDELLAELGLTPYAHWPAALCPLHVRKRATIARALAGNPRLLLMDEPASGLTPAQRDELAQTLERIRKAHGTSILLIEHDMALVMHVSDSVVVLDFGKKIAEGRPAEVRNNLAVVNAYLGRTG